jgi:hypothetical protein
MINKAGYSRRTQKAKDYRDRYLCSFWYDIREQLKHDSALYKEKVQNIEEEKS